MIRTYSKTELDPMKDEDFFRELGQRIAALRQQTGLTQAELAERLGLRQQVVATYENATRRLPSSLTLPLCDIFGVTLEELFGVERSKAKPGRAPKLQKIFDAVAELPKPQQQRILGTVEDMLIAQRAKAS